MGADTGSNAIDSALDTLKIIEGEGNKIFKTDSAWASILYRVFSSRQGRYFNSAVYSTARTQLKRMLSAKNSLIEEGVFYHYFAGYQAYFQIIRSFEDLRYVNMDRSSKTRLYFIPLYTSLLEGTLSNLYRTMVLIIDSVSDKDYTSQNSLKQLVQVLGANELGVCTESVNVDYRNSINHGGARIGDNGGEIEFTFKRNGSEVRESVGAASFETQLYSVLDSVTGLVLALAVTLGEHLGSLSDITYKPTKLAILGIQLSDRECHFSDCFDVEQNKQINLVFEVLNTNEDYLFPKAGELAHKAHELMSCYESYNIMFKHPRLASNFIRIKREYIEACDTCETSKKVLVSLAIKDGDILWIPARDEDINLQEALYFRFPNFESQQFRIYDVEDISLEDRKRIKACIYVGGLSDKLELLDVIDAAIQWLKTQYNPPSPTVPKKYGVSEADLVCFNVYRDDTRSGRSQLESNENFICAVEWCENDEYRLKDNPFAPHLTKNKEQLGQTLIRWRNRKNLQATNRKEAGRNDLCPCGSRKKYKKCCGI